MPSRRSPLAVEKRARNAGPTPSKIMQIGLGFWDSKTLLTAVELGLFTELARGPLDGSKLRDCLGLHARSARDFFDTLYKDSTQLKRFLQAMTGLSMGAAKAIAKKFAWRRYKTFADIGTAQGGLPVQVALAHPGLTGIGFDLPPIQPIFEEYVSSFGLANRLRFQPGSFFSDPLPGADVLVMGHILHDWDLEEKRALIAKAYKALPKGGALLVFEALIND